MSGKYALIIGNTEYIDPGLAQLSAPGKDAEDFARVLKDKEIGAFDDVKVIVNEPSASVIEAIDEFFDQKKPDDMLVLYFSGHGIRDEAGSLYLAFKNTIRSRLRATAIKSEYIREAMDQSRSKRQVLILDCCNSGAFPPGTKADIGGTMGLSTAFQGYGRFVLTASNAIQFAWDGGQLIGETKNSLFTHFLVKGLEGEADSDGDGRITVDDLYDYTYDQISRATPNQTPTKSASKVEGEIVLRQSTRIEDIKPVPLPDDLTVAIKSSLPFIREGAVRQLEELLKGKNLGLARSARQALESILEGDDSRQVSRAAFLALETIHQAEKLALQKVEEERLAVEVLDAENKAREEAELLTEQKAEAERKAREEAEQIAIQKVEKERLVAKAEAERLAREKADAEGKAQEEAQRLANKAEAERMSRERGKSKANTPLNRRSGFLYAGIFFLVFIFGAVCCYIGYGMVKLSNNPTVRSTPTFFPLPDISNAHLSLDADDTIPTNGYSPSDSSFYCYFDLNNAPDSTVVKGVWTLISADGYESNSEIDSAEITGGDNTYYFSLGGSTDLWPVGKYKIDLFINGKFTQKIEFEVR